MQALSLRHGAERVARRLPIQSANYESVLSLRSRHQVRTRRQRKDDMSGRARYATWLKRYWIGLLAVGLSAVGIYVLFANSGKAQSGRSQQGAGAARGVPVITAKARTG